MKNYLLLLCFLGFYGISCSSDDNSKSSSQDQLKYEDFVDENMALILKSELGLVPYEGDTPPFIEGTYKVDPFFCKKSNFSDFYEGENFGTMDLKFFNQNDALRSIDFNSLLTYNPGFTGTIEHWDGKGCFISGSENKFTIAFHTDGKLEVGGGAVALYKNLIMVCGELDVDEKGVIKGIKDYKMASVMLDDFGDPLNALIAIGKGRLFTDDYVVRN